MAKTKSILFISFISILTLACRPDISAVFIKNESNVPVVVAAKLLVSEGPQEMKFELAPDTEDGWMYETDNTSKIDEALRTITITSETGCNKTLSREQLAPIHRGKSTWVINIDDSLLNCV